MNAWEMASRVIEIARAVPGKLDTFDQWLTGMKRAVEARSTYDCQKKNIRIWIELSLLMEAEVPGKIKNNLRLLMLVVEFFSALAMAGIYCPSLSDVEDLYDRIQGAVCQS